MSCFARVMLQQRQAWARGPAGPRSVSGLIKTRLSESETGVGTNLSMGTGPLSGSIILHASATCQFVNTLNEEVFTDMKAPVTTFNCVKTRLD